MKKILVKCMCFVSLFMFSSLITLAQQPKTAIEMNDALSVITDSLYARGTAWATLLNKATETKDYSVLVQVRKEIDKYLDKQIVYVKGLKDVNGSENLRNATISFLNLEKEMMKTGFAPFEKLNASSSEAELNALIDKVTELSKQEDEAIKAMSKAQDEYAAKNGFKIEGDESDEE